MFSATEEEDKAAAAAPVSVPTHSISIGMIHPPPDHMRSIVDKTAQFVSKNGAKFEKTIMSQNINNAKFNFLNASDPYHAYYQHRLASEKAASELAQSLSQMRVKL